MASLVHAIIVVAKLAEPLANVGEAEAVVLEAVRQKHDTLRLLKFNLLRLSNLPLNTLYSHCDSTIFL